MTVICIAIRASDPKMKNIYKEDPVGWPEGVFFGDPNNKGQRERKPDRETIRKMCHTLWDLCRVKIDF